MLSNPQSIDQAIKKLKEEILKETGELQKKDTELKKYTQEVIILRQELLDMQKGLENKKKQLNEHNRTIPKLTSEVEMLKRKQATNHANLNKTQREFEETLKESQVNTRR